MMYIIILTKFDIDQLKISSYMVYCSYNIYIYMYIKTFISDIAVSFLSKSKNIFLNIKVLFEGYIKKF
jgi:hypothetical protein